MFGEAHRGPNKGRMRMGAEGWGDTPLGEVAREQERYDQLVELPGVELKKLKIAGDSQASAVLDERKRMLEMPGTELIPLAHDNRHAKRVLDYRQAQEREDYDPWGDIGHTEAA